MTVTALRKMYRVTCLCGWCWYLSTPIGEKPDAVVMPCPRCQQKKSLGLPRPSEVARVVAVRKHAMGGMDLDEMREAWGQVPPLVLMEAGDFRPIWDRGYVA